MTFVSYAQNFEDVMLWRALGDVRDGFYIDVGAGDPDRNSVTRAFYERGWRGINVEPDPARFAALVRRRERDVNLRLALADTAGTRRFHVVGVPGLSTLDSAVAFRHRARGWPVHRTRVEVDTLAAICRQHAPGTIHFLKIDVEGGEAAVLRGADFISFRPWIVLAEATVPLSQQVSHAEWEPILLAAAYRFVWFDGLNRFYVAEERHAALEPHFRLPPNCFDQFIMADPAREALEEELRAARAEVDALRSRLTAGAPQCQPGRDALPPPRLDDVVVHTQVQALCQQAIALRLSGQLQEALVSAERALELEPADVEALNTRGGILLELNRLDEAFACYDRIIAMDPTLASAHYNRAVVQHRLNRHADAIADYDRAIDLRPESANARWNRSLCLLALGDFERGWREYECRWQTSMLQADKRDFVQPLWVGEEELGGRTILLHGEQGFGDILQFCRYVPLVAQQANVVLQVPGPLIRLLTTMDEGGQIIATDDLLPPFDLHCPLLSLPLAFRTTLRSIPASIPYLRADAADSAVWRERIAALRGLKVGLVWAGGIRPHQPETLPIDRRRSLPLAALAPLATVGGCSFVSLQKGEARNQAEQPPPGLVLHDFTVHLQDFADTAALIDNLDLVITVDTAVAHLAGAMGKPVWLLNRFDSCWRWLTDRDDSPWYPSLRQFRQDSPGDWATPIRRVVDALRQLVG